VRVVFHGVVEVAVVVVAAEAEVTPPVEVSPPVPAVEVASDVSCTAAGMVVALSCPLSPVTCKLFSTITVLVEVAVPAELVATYAIVYVPAADVSIWTFALLSTVHCQL
jgi:hypothetical protein